MRRVPSTIRVGLHAVGLALTLNYGLPPICRAIDDALHSWQYRDVDLATLGNFELDEKTGTLCDIPPAVRALDGKRVSLHGTMIPIDQADRMTSFALIDHPRYGENWWCPQVQDVCVAVMPAGSRTRYSPDKVRVDGAFRVAIERQDGYLWSVFTVTPDRVTRWPEPDRKVVPCVLGVLGGIVVMASPAVAGRIGRHARRPVGTCAGCGYDLRATPGRCPECGREAVRGAVAAGGDGCRP